MFINEKERLDSYDDQFIDDKQKAVFKALANLNLGIKESHLFILSILQSPMTSMEIAAKLNYSNSHVHTTLKILTLQNHVGTSKFGNTRRFYISENIKKRLYHGEEDEQPEKSSD